MFPDSHIIKDVVMGPTEIAYMLGFYTVLFFKQSLNSDSRALASYFVGFDLLILGIFLGN